MDKTGALLCFNLQIISKAVSFFISRQPFGLVKVWCYWSPLHIGCGILQPLTLLVDGMPTTS